jgi:hypothetical protein
MKRDMQWGGMSLSDARVRCHCWITEQEAKRYCAFDEIAEQGHAVSLWQSGRQNPEVITLLFAATLTMQRICRLTDGCMIFGVGVIKGTTLIRKPRVHAC